MRNVIQAALISMAMTTPLVAQEAETVHEVYSIAAEIKASNDCSDRNNAECKTLFETTCAWVAESVPTLIIGVTRQVPPDMIWQKLFDNMSEIADGSGGYVDTDLANSYMEQMADYLPSGQLEADLATLNDSKIDALVVQTKMLLAINPDGGYANDPAGQKLLQLIDLSKGRITQIWVDRCMSSVYF